MTELQSHMPERTSRFSPDQIGTTAVRFPSGVPIPTATDAAVDPYFKTRVPKDVQVEGVMLWPQEKGTYPGVVVLHERWGLTAQIKAIAMSLAQEGYMVLIPNLYGRQGGMVTANTEVADALVTRMKEAEVLQDINSCCEFMNTRDQIKKNVHGVVGLGMGGSLAIRFACQRKRLRAAVAFYAKVTTPSTVLKDLVGPILYHRAGADPSVTSEDIALLEKASQESGKPVTIKTYDTAPHAFLDNSRKNAYHLEASNAAWESTLAFLNAHLHGER